MNFRDELIAAKTKLASFEQRVTKGLANLVLTSTSLMDKFVALVIKADGELPTIETDLNNPIVKAFVASLGGTQYLTEVVAILNRVAPLLKAIEGDQTLFNGAIHHVSAEILLVLNGGVTDANTAINDIQQAFIPVAEG